MTQKCHVPFWRAVGEETSSLTLIILRKAFPKAFADGIESCVVQPRLVTPTKEKMKVKAEMLFMAV